MCGFVGFLGGKIAKNNELANTTLMSMASEINARGPDSSGTWSDPDSDREFDEHLEALDLVFNRCDKIHLRRRNRASGKQPSSYATRRWLGQVLLRKRPQCSPPRSNSGDARAATSHRTGPASGQRVLQTCRVVAITTSSKFSAWPRTNAARGSHPRGRKFRG